MPPDRDAAAERAVDRWWDEIAQGRTDDLATVDTADMAVIRYLHAGDERTEHPDRHFAARLREDLMHRHMHTHANVGSRGIDAGPAAPLRVPSRWAIRPTSGRALGLVATVALVLLTVAFAVAAFSWSRSRQPDEPVMGVPAPVAPVEDGTLVAFDLPAGAIPTGIVSGLNHYTFAPGPPSRWDPANYGAECCTGVRLNYVLSGSYTMRGDGPLLVRRAGSDAPEEIPAATDLVLETGDTVVSRTEDGFAVTNSGTEPVELLDGVMFAGYSSDDPVPQESSGRRSWAFHDQDIQLRPLPVPATPVTLRLRHETIAGSGELPPPPGAIIQLGITVGSSAIVITDGQTADVPYLVRNLDPVPVGLYLLTIEPAAGGSPAAAAPEP